jgi:ectoine hydroxylase-related dioxygenase (phytanoyl-CoA dioxygenase family)
MAMHFHRLDDDQRQQFEDDGFLILRGALDERRRGELLAASDALMASGQTCDRAYDNDAYNGFRNVVAHGGAPFEQLLTHGPTVSLAAQLLSRNIQLHTSQLIYKHPAAPGTDPAGLIPGWHRDIHTLPQDLGDEDNRRVEVKIAYFLALAPGRAGGVTLVARGSHRWRQPPAFDASGDPPGVVVPDVEPGDALLFENRTWHAASVNTSRITRTCVIYGYSYRWMRPDDWVEQDPRLLERLDGVGRDLLTPMRWRDAEGRFSLKPNIAALPEWFDRNGAVGSAQAARQALQTA